MRFAVTAFVLMGMVLAGCGRNDGARPQQVSVYMYSEYIDPQILKDFEKQTGVKVRLDVYENSEEMLAKLQQGGGASQYDVIVVSDAHVPALIQLGLVRPLEMEKVPNVSHVDGKFRNPPFDPGNKYSLPYQWGTVGLMYAKDKVGSAELSWAMVFDPARQPGKFILMDSMRDMLGIALKYQGKSMNSRNPQEVKAAGELVLRAKRSANFLGFEGGVGGKNRVLAGDAVAAICYNGDAIRGVAENDKVAFAVPKEGGIIWVDVMLVTARGPNSEGAHQFINYILEPKVGAQLSNFNRYPTPNQGSMPFIRDEDRQNVAIYPGDEVVQKLEYLRDLDQDTRLYDEIWTTVKAQ